MPRRRRGNLTPPTELDLQTTPDSVIKGPNGALMWRCRDCGRPASSETLKGDRVCRFHGGATKRQTDPLEHDKAILEGKKPPRPPGRPAEHGFYSRDERIKIDQLIADYEARGLDPNETTEDMLYLRAYIDELKQVRPAVEQVVKALEALVAETQRLLAQPTTENMTVEQVLQMLGEVKQWHAILQDANRLYYGCMRYTAEIEARHERVIQLARVRADTKLKHAAANQLKLFDMLLSRLTIVLAEMLPRDAYEALQGRLQRDFDEVSKRNLKPGTVKA